MELCIDFGGTEIKLALIDGGRVIGSRSLPIDGTPSDLAGAAIAARRLLADTGRTADAVGIAVPGVVDPNTGRMLHANAKYDFLRDFDLSTWSVAEFGLSAIVENDARAALIGETSSGSAAGERDVVLVTLGTGIGTAALIAGAPLRGRTGHAGILGGHLTVDLDGPVCPCGNIGCGEALASTWALDASTSSATQREAVAAATQGGAAATQRGAAATQSGAAATQSEAAATHGGAAANPGETGTVTMTDVFTTDAHPALRDRFLHVWGAVVTSLVHSYDPSVVILSGGILRAGDAVRAPIEAHVRQHLWPSMTPPRFAVPPEPELSVARGLSVLARAATSPLSTHPFSPDPALYGGAQRAGSDARGRVDPADIDPGTTHTTHPDQEEQ